MAGQSKDEFQRLMNGGGRQEQLKRVVRTSSKHIEKRQKGRVPLSDITNMATVFNRTDMKPRHSPSILSSHINKLHTTPMIRHDLGFRASKRVIQEEANYGEITKQILMLAPYTNVNKFEDIRLQANHYIRSLIGWYKLNNYNFITDANSSNPQEGLDTATSSSPSLLASLGLALVKYKSMATHKTAKVTAIGKFMIAVTIRCLKSEEVTTVFLVRPDIKVEVICGDLLDLRDENSYSQPMNGSHVKVYSRWRVYKS